MTRTYLFYDLETSGLNKCFDQVMQFAAIRTNEQFEEIERHEFFVKLNPDVAPHPDALITHRVSIKQANEGVAEYEAITKIHQLMNQPGTVSLGYNTLGYDDEFLRFSFYRNLLPPYTHQYANQCSRMDLYPVVVFYYLFKPEVLQWPIVDGKVSLKLERLSELNQLAVGQAHNALVDVEATVSLAKRLKQYADIWQYVSGFFNKRIDADRSGLSEAILVDGKMGGSQNFMAPVLSLGQHAHYKNQMLWLRLDFHDFSSLKGPLEDSAFVIRKRLAEPPFLLPPEARFSKKMSDERLALADANKAWLIEHKHKWKALQDYYCHYKYPDIPNLDLDAALYQRPFARPVDEKQMQAFHRASLQEKSNAAEQFYDELYREQAIRLLGRNYPDLLNSEQQAIFLEYLSLANQPQAVVDYRNQAKLDLASLKERVLELRQSESLDTKQLELLSEWLNTYN